MLGGLRCRFSWPEPTSTPPARAAPKEAVSTASHPTRVDSVTSPLMSGPLPHFMYIGIEDSLYSQAVGLVEESADGHFQAVHLAEIRSKKPWTTVPCASFSSNGV